MAVILVAFRATASDSIPVVKDARLDILSIKQAQANNLALGKDLGIISYNDTPLKSIVANGITTISTDFYAMGRNIANLIINRKKDLLISLF